MLRYLFLLVSVSVSALGAVAFLNENPEVLETAATVARDKVDVARANRTMAEEPAAPLSGTERLRADARGHYVAQFTLNSRRVTGVVDTGATMVAMGSSQARQLGIHLTDSDFVYQAATANGTAKAARVVLDEVRLGSIRVRNVEAMVLEDDQLGIVLIGMTFLNRLRNFKFANGMLEMKV